MQKMRTEWKKSGPVLQMFKCTCGKRCPRNKNRMETV